MRKHPSESVAKFEYGIASYPLEYKAYLISPQKICMQFSKVQCKTRAPFSKEGLTSRNGGYEMPVHTHGTEIDTLAVGIPLDMYPELLTNILKAISEHDKLHPEHSIKKEIQEIISREF